MGTPRREKPECPCVKLLRAISPQGRGNGAFLIGVVSGTLSVVLRTPAPPEGGAKGDILLTPNSQTT